MLKKILIGLVVLVALFCAIGLMLPAQVHLERTALIHATPEAIWPHIAEFERSNAWSPWAQRDPNTKWTYSGPISGVGAKVVWASEKDDVGNGSQETLEYTPHTFLKNKLDFGAQGTAEAFFKLDKAEGGDTRITWGFDSDLGANPVARWFGLMFESMIGPDYEQGLASLKALVEGGGAAPAAAPAKG